MDGSTLITFSLLGVFLLICTLVVLAALIYRTVRATITGFFWSRDIFFVHYVWVKESSLSGFPSGSRNQYSRRELSLYIEDGRGVIDVRTKYFYEIQRWVGSRKLHTEGTERVTRHWPVYQLNQSTWERVEKTQENYLVFFQTAKGKRLQGKLLENVWAILDEQPTYTVKVNFFGHVKQFTPETQQMITAAKHLP